MKWTLDWLRDYLNTDATPDVISDTLTRIGLEIEEVTSPVAPIAALVVECAPHENSDHLHVLKVDDGTGTLRQVVCGAPNARVGIISALAVPGCVICGHEIQSGKLRGVLSDGMMCSERELGLSDNHDGIIELPAGTVLGSPVINIPTVFDAGITPNRPDYLAVRGIARDLAAAGVGEYVSVPDIVLPDAPSARHANIETDKCAVYRMAEIRNITMAPSDKKISSRLAAIGINPKNAAVDATNYVCYDMGQPMHCFDADKVDGDIFIRPAHDGEEFTDLFGTLHKLKDTDIVISDASGILALAGVIGGARAGVTALTKNIILESAYFDPVSVRKTSKRLGISTDASYRYERGIDPTITMPALGMAARIIVDACGGDIVGVYTSGQIPAPRPAIKYNPDMFAAKTGIDIPANIQADILRRLGFVVDIDGKDWQITASAARVDMEIPENIIADLARLYGYDRIASASHRALSDVAPHTDENLQLKQMLASRGLNEVVSFGFGNAATEKLLSDAPSIMISNPITADMDTARNSLLGNMLNAVATNESRGYPNLALFEVGTVFTGTAPGDQNSQICIVRTGRTGPRHWMGRTRDVDVYDVKADIVALMQGARFTISTDNAPRWAHPYRYGRIMQGKKQIAEFGELHPQVARALKIKTKVVVAIVGDVANLPTHRRRPSLDFSDFQPRTRDFAFIVDAATPAGTLTAAAQSADPHITEVTVFDAFDMGNDKKSIALTVTILPDKNMTDDDLMAIQNAVIAAAQKKCNAQIRDK